MVATERESENKRHYINGEIRAYLCPDRTDTVERRKLKMGEERQR